MLRITRKPLAWICAIVLCFSLLSGIVLPQVAETALAVADPYAAAPTSANHVLDLENDVKWLGRTHVLSNRHYFTWSNSGFEFNFNGTAAYATMHFTNNYSSSVEKHDTAYLWVYVDGEKTNVIELKEATQEVTLAKNLTKGDHTIKVVKRVNGRSNQAAVSAIWLNEGGYVTLPNVESGRKMQFIGDSITVGYASINDVVKESEWSVHSEDSTVAYAALTAEYFSADNHTIAISGRGVLYNTGGKKDTANHAPLMYNYNDWTLKRQWDHSQYQPDVVVINLGTNDDSSCKTEADKEDFKAAVKSFIQQVRGVNLNAHIIWAFGAMGDTNGLRSYIEAAIAELNAAGDKKIYYIHLPEGEKSLGHPVASAHADLADILIEKVTEVTGWTKHTTHNYTRENYSTSDGKTPGLDKYTCADCGDVYTAVADPYAESNEQTNVLTVSDGQVTLSDGSKLTVPAEYQDATIREPKDDRLRFFDVDWTASNLGITDAVGTKFLMQYGDGETWGNGDVYVMSWRVNAYGAKQYADTTDLGGNVVTDAGTDTGWADMMEDIRHSTPIVGEDNNWYVLLFPGEMTHATSHSFAETEYDYPRKEGSNTTRECIQADYTNVNFFGPQAGVSPSAGVVGDTTLMNDRSADP
ncbi:MAG: hypothetical protein IKY33_01915, partial [Clostridia bacterium]|nr:hypothetical protein [Clostridia bacterium]